MDVFLQFAKAWTPVVELAVAVLILLYVVETRLQRIATITANAPNLRIGLDYDRNPEPLVTLKHLGGRIAYNVQLDGFNSRVGGERVVCAFPRISQIAYGEAVDLSSPKGLYVQGERVLDALRVRTGLYTGFPLRLHYQDATGMHYFAHVLMPSYMEIAFKVQPKCSPPHALTIMGRVLEALRWPPKAFFLRGKGRLEKELYHRRLWPSAPRLRRRE